MIHGNRASGYTVTGDGDGVRREGETRQCVHCQYTWEYVPGSGTRRGWCLKHGGFICARPECEHQQQELTSQYLVLTGRVVSCLAFEEWNNELMEIAGRQHGRLGTDFELTASGVIIPKEYIHG